jgi:hypothetical protein
MGNFTLTKYGQISAYNPNDYTVKVLILPNLTDETGFIPLSAPWVGNNFGAVFGPGIGDSVRLDFMDGRVEATVVGGRFFNNSARPPVVQSGQAAIVDSQGSYVKLNNDGTLTIGAPVGITSTTPLLKQIGNFEVDGTMLVTETITGQGGITISGDNGTGNASTVNGDFDTTGTITNNGHDIGSTHKHLNSGGSGLGGVPQ